MIIFNTAVKKLALTYVCVLMIVSLSASFAMYKIADKQFETGLRRQQNEFVNRQQPRPILRELDELRHREQSSARANLLFGLLIFNTVVLIGGGYFCYNSARSTLMPIKKAMIAQNRFTADASHELRTPLSAMKSEVEVALRDKNLKIAEARQVLTSNLEEINNLEQLTVGLLTLARSPQETIHLSPLDLAGIIKLAEKQVAKSYQQSKVKIINKIKSNHFVMAEETTLTRLIVILLDNALKYSHNSKVIEINSVSHNNKTKVIIKDYGLGIKPNDLGKIFDRFYRSDTSRTKSNNSRGYGLGLSIAYSIAKQYDTKINVISVYGEGSEFSFLLKNAPHNDKIIADGKKDPA